MSLTLHHVDAFTERAFAGNPAAICMLPEEYPTGWRQQLAREMNLSETAFLLRRNDAWQLRWFTPGREVDLCGHATLASAHVLWETGALQRGESAKFDTRSGRLTAVRQGDLIEMDFPADAPQPCAAPAGLMEALGSPPVVACAKASHYQMVHVESEADVRGLDLDFTAMMRATRDGVIVTAESDDDQYDFVSRFFAPAFRVNEDPVTGSAHCVLGPYWAARLGCNDLTGYQASERGGIVRVRLPDGPVGRRVLLGGKAITVMRATLTGTALPSRSAAEV